MHMVVLIKKRLSLLCVFLYIFFASQRLENLQIHKLTLYNANTHTPNTYYTHVELLSDESGKDMCIYFLQVLIILLIFRCIFQTMVLTAFAWAINLRSAQTAQCYVITFTCAKAMYAHICSCTGTH